MSATVLPVLASGLAAATEARRALPMAPWVYGAIALAGFLLVLAITWSFRNTAARAPRRARGGQPGGGQH